MLKSIVRKVKSDIANKKDFYQTNPYMVAVLVDWCKEQNFPRDWRVLDPCCGEGVISEGLKEYFYNVEAYDKYTGENKKDFLEEKREFDLIVHNTPFSAKYEFIQHSWKLAQHVITLLPLNWNNYNCAHRDYLDRLDFVGMIQMAPKMFLDETTDFKSGGNSQYDWLYWNRENNTRTSLTWYYDLLKYKNK